MITSKVLKTISENSNNGKTWGMWILQYFDDAKSISVKVVCGEKKVKDGGDIWYVAKGMGVRDFAALKPHYAEFAKLAANPPAFADGSGNDESIEEVPF